MNVNRPTPLMFVVNRIDDDEVDDVYRKYSNPTIVFAEKEIEIVGLTFKVDLKKFSSEQHGLSNTHDENEQLGMVELVVHNRNFRCYLRLTEKSINPFIESSVCSVCSFSLSKYAEILKSIFVNESEKRESFEYRFELCGDTTKPAPQPKFLSKKSGHSKRRKISLNQNIDLNLCDFDLFLFLNIRFGRRIITNLVLRFDFFTIPVFEIGPLPDEIMIELFRFLPSRFLFRNVALVQRRFHNLIETEYMYRRHHLEDLNRGIRISMDKSNDESWKEFTKRKYCQRAYWIPESLDIISHYVTRDSGPEGHKPSKYCKIDEYGMKLSISNDACEHGIGCFVPLKFNLSGEFEFMFAIHNADQITPKLFDNYLTYPAMVTVGFVPIRERSITDIAESDFMCGDNGEDDYYFGLLSHGKWDSNGSKFGEGNYSPKKIREEVLKMKPGEEIIVKMSLLNRVIRVEVKIGGNVMLSSFTLEPTRKDEEFIVGAGVCYPLMYEIIN